MTSSTDPPAMTTLERNLAQAQRREVTAGDDTIAGYWMSHGYSKAEALQIEREQIREAMAREELYDSMEYDPF